jgi:MOSC domain-containing protein YiiM
MYDASTTDTSSQGRLVAICTSAGGIPKQASDHGEVRSQGLLGDGHNHAKHVRPDRAISLFDLEILQDLVQEGFPLSPGAAGENLTVEGLNVQQMLPGTLLQIGHVMLRLEAPRKPCYVLDAIDPRLKESILGRCGYMASVVRGGMLEADMAIRCLPCEPIVLV